MKIPTAVSVIIILAVVALVVIGGCSRKGQAPAPEQTIPQQPAEQPAQKVEQQQAQPQQEAAQQSQSPPQQAEADDDIYSDNLEESIEELDQLG